MKKYKVTLHNDMAAFSIVEAESMEAAIEQVMRKAKDVDVNNLVLLGQRAEAEVAQDDVAFRVTETGEVVGLFSGYLPDENDLYPAYSLSKGLYQCDFASVFESSREATPEEYASLKKAMEAKGYSLHVMSTEEAKESVEDYNEDDKNIVKTAYGTASLVYRDEGYGGYFDVYVRSNEKVKRYDVFIGSINDTEDEEAMFAELEDIIKEYNETKM